MKVFLDFSKMSRQMSKDRWKEIWRWKRVQENKTNELDRKKCDVLILENVPLDIKRKVAEDLVNPSILMGPLE